MQAFVDTWLAALQLTVMLVIGWVVVYLVSRVTERRLRRKSRGGSAQGLLATTSWVWDNSNIIGIPTLLFGAAYLIWSMNWGPGLSAGPTMLVIFLMAAAGCLIGIAPALRR
jgi:hypothetical protein